MGFSLMPILCFLKLFQSWKTSSSSCSSLIGIVCPSHTCDFFFDFHLFVYGLFVCFFFFSIFSKPVEPERLFDCLPNSLRPSSGSPGDSNAKNPSSNNHHEHHNSNLDNAVYTPPALIPPRVLPLLHDLAQQMFQAGHQQKLLLIYR